MWFDDCTPAELACVSVALSSTENAWLVLDQCPPARFVHPIAHDIMDAVAAVTTQQQPIDVISVSQALSKETLHIIGGIPGLMEALASMPAFPSNLSYYAQQVSAQYARLSLQTAAQQLHRDATDDTQDPLTILTTFQQKATKILAPTLTGPQLIAHSIDTLVDQWMHPETATPPITLGASEWDQQTGGFHSEELTILAGRPSMGKTLLALQWAVTLVQRQISAAFFSLEMPVEALTLRVLSSVSHIPLTTLRQPQLPSEVWNNLLQACDLIREWPLFLDAPPSLSPLALRAHLNTLITQHQVQWAAVDYLQLMQPDTHHNNREQDIASMTRELKQVARTLHIPLIVLSQLSRKVEERPDKRPMMSDLRESGAIEQDADQIFLLYRPSYYDREAADDIEVILAKNRQGSTGVLNCPWNPETGTILFP